MNTTQDTAIMAQPQQLCVFGNIQDFETGQRMAKVLATSPLVPQAYHGDIASSLIALNMAQRMQADPLQVMQSLYIVHGRPAFSSAFLIACFNRSNKYSTIRYEFSGEPNTDEYGCVATTTELATGEIIKGTKVTIGMAKAEGWYNKNGSKWKTMPDLMLRYRSAAFLIRTTAPEIALGFPTQDEVLDITDQVSYVEDTPSLDQLALQAATPTTEAEPAEEAAEPTTESAPTSLFDDNDPEQ